MGCVNEADIRTAIAERAVTPSTLARRLVVSELAVCQAEARVDVAVVDARGLVGWEIKSEADSLDRLPRQQAVYGRVFDRMWLAADARHIRRALDVIPDWWGVVRVEDHDGSCRLTQVRASRLNRDVDLHALVELLWREEVLTELDQLGLSAGRTRAPRRELWRALADASPKFISPAKLRSRVRGRIMARRDWRAG